MTKTEKLIEKVLKLDAIYDDPEASDAASLEAQAGLAVRAATLAIALQKAIEQRNGHAKGWSSLLTLDDAEIDEIVEGK